MSMRLNTYPPTRYIVVYMPQACGMSWEGKSEYYDRLNDLMDTMPKKEPLYILGDFNARLQARPKDEEEYIGPYVYGRGPDYATEQQARAHENREFS